VISKNGTPNGTYYYRKNARGDITHIMDANGNVKGEYVYDAWGNHIIVQDDDDVASINPFRYRGYYYDQETNLYHLRSRYYDPQTGRFISADDVGVFEETHGDINGLNLYAYCANNPIMFCDPTGQLFGWIKKNVKAIGDFIVDNAVDIALVAVGTALCFVPGAQGIGVSLIVAGSLGLMSSGLVAAGVDSRTVSIISSLTSIAIGVALCATGVGAGIGATLIFSGIGELAGGYIGEKMGFGYDMGATVGSIVGSIAGGRIYNHVHFSKIAKQGIAIGKGNWHKGFASANGLYTYNGMSGYKIIEKISPSIARRLGWAHNHNYIKSVMRYSGRIYDIGGSATGSYARELKLISGYGNVSKHYLIGFI